MSHIAGITYHVTPAMIKRAKAQGLAVPEPGFYRLQPNGKYRNVETNKIAGKVKVDNARFGRPARRKGWADLSPAYKKRLRRAGITKGSYNKGSTNLAKARGHVEEQKRPGQQTAPKWYRKLSSRQYKKENTNHIFYRLGEDRDLSVSKLFRKYPDARASYIFTGNSIDKFTGEILKENIKVSTRVFKLSEWQTSGEKAIEELLAELDRSQISFEIEETVLQIILPGGKK